MYSIGQVLFIVLSKKNQVYPMQVIEVITKKMMNGEDVSYVLQAGSEKSTKITLDQVDGEVFETADKARKVLIQRATTQINKLIDNSIAKANEWYGPQASQRREVPQMIQDLPDLISKNETTNEPQRSSAVIEENTQTVMMPDGSVVRVKMPAIM